MPLPMYEEKEPTTPARPLDKVKHIIGVASGKGGVGKSTVTAHLAHALKARGFQIGVLDCDIYGPSLRQMLPEDSLPKQRGGMIVPAQSNGLALVSLAFFRPENEAAVIRAPIANGVIQQFLNSVDWGEIDFLLIDFPPGTGDVQLTISQHAHLKGVVMVTTPQEVALLDVRKAMDMFTQVKIQALGVVENMSYFCPLESGLKVYPFGRDGGERLAKERGVPFLGQIPVDEILSIQGDLGIVQAHTAFFGVVDKLLEQISEEVDSDSITIKKMVQVDPHILSITWSDGKVDQFAYATLQKNCPCAACVTSQSVEPQVKVNQIEAVGQYALRFAFTSGCRKGIYHFDFLRMLSREALLKGVS